MPQQVFQDVNIWSMPCSDCLSNHTFKLCEQTPVFIVAPNHNFSPYNNNITLKRWSNVHLQKPLLSVIIWVNSDKKAAQVSFEANSLQTEVQISCSKLWECLGIHKAACHAEEYNPKGDATSNFTVTYPPSYIALHVFILCPTAAHGVTKIKHNLKETSYAASKLWDTPYGINTDQINGKRFFSHTPILVSRLAGNTGWTRGHLFTKLPLGWKPKELNESNYKKRPYY